MCRIPVFFLNGILDQKHKQNIGYSGTFKTKHGPYVFNISHWGSTDMLVGLFLNFQRQARVGTPNPSCIIKWNGSFPRAARRQLISTLIYINKILFAVPQRTAWETQHDDWTQQITLNFTSSEERNRNNLLTLF